MVFKDAKNPEATHFHSDPYYYVLPYLMIPMCTIGSSDMYTLSLLGLQALGLGVYIRQTPYVYKNH